MNETLKTISDGLRKGIEGRGVFAKWVMEEIKWKDNSFCLPFTHTHTHTHTLRIQVPLRTSFQRAKTHEAVCVCVGGIQGLSVN